MKWKRDKNMKTKVKDMDSMLYYAAMIVVILLMALGRGII